MMMIPPASPTSAASTASLVQPKARKGGGVVAAAAAAAANGQQQEDVDDNNDDENDADNNKYGKKKVRKARKNNNNNNNKKNNNHHNHNHRFTLSTSMRNWLLVCGLVAFSLSVTVVTFGIMYAISQFHQNPNGSHWSASARWNRLRKRGEEDYGDGVVVVVPGGGAAVLDESHLRSLSMTELLSLFDRMRPKDLTKRLTFETKNAITPLLRDWARRLDDTMRDNTAGGIRWIQPFLLPPLYNYDGVPKLIPSPGHRQEDEIKTFYNVKRRRNAHAPGGGEAGGTWKWEQEWQELKRQQQEQQQQQQQSKLGPPVDYTQEHLYEYPPLLSEPPAHGGYPKTISLGELMRLWPQNQDYFDDDDKGNKKKYRETLLHFNYSDPAERAMAQRFRDARLPFKLYDIPQITHLTHLWTDDYVAQEFDPTITPTTFNTIAADGVCQESPDHFFAFYVPPLWQATTMGLPPVRNNDFSFHQWAEHAKYADAKPLAYDQPHYYWQAGTTKQERFQSKQSFITRDLNETLGSATSNFFVFNIKEQKGIQCRFGERGVTAATHYDAGQNMIAMITGAKRYVLSPPKACPQLALFSDRDSPIFRHSLLNFAHLSYLDNNNNNNNNNHNNNDEGSGGGDVLLDAEGRSMSREEREWLRRAAQAPALDTVLRAGQVLFLPSFWFHYIVSIQKSAQCNVRSGVDQSGSREFGGFSDIQKC